MPSMERLNLDVLGERLRRQRKHQQDDAASVAEMMQIPEQVEITPRWRMGSDPMWKRDTVYRFCHTLECTTTNYLLGRTDDPQPRHPRNARGPPRPRRWARRRDMRTTTTPYDQDFYAWTQEQAALLREGAVQELDVINLAEEVEDLGARDQREHAAATGASWSSICSSGSTSPLGARRDTVGGRPSGRPNGRRSRTSSKSVLTAHRA